MKGHDDNVLICNRCVDELTNTINSEERRAGAKKKREEPLRKPIEIKQFLDQHVIGQNQAKEDIAVAVYDHFKRREAFRKGGEEDGVEIQKSNVILMGPSGMGKTEIARAVARLLRVPFYVGDATRLTQAGYVGDDVETLLQGLLQEAGGDNEKAEWGIIFLDEADKLAKKSGRGATGYRDVSGEGVQQSLLKLVEGSKVPVIRRGNVETVDTTNILFVFAGSFAGIDEAVSRRVNKGARMGFGSADLGKKELTKTEVYQQITEEDLLEFGLIPELLGRLPVRTSVYELTEEEMVRVLTEPKNSILKQKRALFALDNIELTFEDAALQAIAKEARTMETGARALRTIVERVIKPYAFSAPSDPSIASIVITEEAVKGGEARLMRRAKAVG
jgi:ATP-dependent Clp protease ATP-binding subunit ClpX